MSLKKTAILTSLVIFICCGCQTTTVHSTIRMIGVSSTSIIESSKEEKDASSTIVESNKDDNNISSITINESSEKTISSLSSLPSSEMISSSIEDIFSSSEIESSSSGEAPSVPTFNISRLVNGPNMIHAYQDFPDIFTDINKRTNIVHNEQELEDYLGHPLSYIEEKNPSNFRSNELLEILDNLESDFFLNNDLIITCRVFVPIGYNIKFLNASLKDELLSLNYLYNPDGYTQQTLFADDDLMDVLAIDKGAPISSIKIKIKNIPDAYNDKESFTALN